MKLSILTLAAACLAVACGGSVAAGGQVAVHRGASTAIVSPLVPDPSPAAATVADEPSAVATPAPAPAPASFLSGDAAPANTRPTAAPPKLPAAVPAVSVPRPTPAPTAPPQRFLVVTVDNAPAMNCSGTPIDCEAPDAYAMAHFQLGERLSYTRVLTDARGQRFYILGPWTPVGLLPIADGKPS